MCCSVRDKLGQALVLLRAYQQKVGHALNLSVLLPPLQHLCAEVKLVRCSWTRQGRIQMPEPQASCLQSTAPLVSQGSTAQWSAVSTYRAGLAQGQASNSSITKAGQLGPAIIQEGRRRERQFLTC